MDVKKLLNDTLRQYKVDTTHSQAAHDEVAYWQQNNGIHDAELLDWTNEPFVTIDNPDSRDLDQALLIESIPANPAHHVDQDDASVSNGYRCRYALADASYYVKPGSALFKEALARGTSYYLPSRSVPMLPTALSEDLVSLNADVERRALVFDMTLTADGVCTRTEIVRARIKSFAKLSYEGVQRWLDNQSKPHDPPIPQESENSLRLLKQLGLLLIERSEDRDVIQFDRRETQISLTANGFELHERERYNTERYNEQISLLCNMQGALLLESLNRLHPELQPIFRVHDAPLKKRRKALADNLVALNKIKTLDERFQRKPEQSLADFIAGLPNDAESKRLVQAIERQVLMINQASEFRAEPGRHHALGAESYARFSSPMREIVGIYTHKELLEALGLEPALDSAFDAAIRSDVIEAANTAKQRQKQLGKAIEFAVIDAHLKSDLEHGSDHTHSGTVMGFRSGRIYVAIDDLAVDLKVYVEDLNEQYQTDYIISDVSAEALNVQQPRFVLGDAVSVKVRAFDAERRRFKLDLYL